jgi:hypothetical protein
LLIPKHAHTIPEKPLGTNEKLVELEVGDLLKVLEVAGEEGQVMLKTRCCNEDVQITNLLSHLLGQAAPDLGKAFHDWSREGQYGFPFQEAS